MKIIFIAGGLGRGGAEKQLYYISKILNEENHSVIVINTSNKNDLLEKFNSSGIKVINISNTKTFIIKFIKLFLLINKFKPNVIQSSHFYTNIYVALFSKLLGIKSISAVRANYTNEMNKKYKFLRKSSLFISTKIVCNSLHAYNQIILDGFSKNKVHFLKNAIDSTIFPFDNSKNFGLKKFLLLGSLQKRKRADKFIEICNNLIKSDIELNARIVGSGPEKISLLKMSKRLKLESPFLEYFEQTPEVIKQFKWANILLLTSENEGTPNVIMEAMLCGVLVFSVDVGDVKEIISDGFNGFIFSSNDPLKMSSEILTKLNYGDKHLKKIVLNARKSIEEKYDIKNLSRSLNQIYLTL